MPHFTNRGFTFNRPTVPVRQYYIVQGPGLIFAWRPKINDPGVTSGQWNPTSNLITWRWLFKGASRAEIRDAGTSTDTIQAADRRRPLGLWTTDRVSSGVFPWRVKLRNVFVYDGGISSDVINAPGPAAISIPDHGSSGDLIDLHSAIDGHVLDLGSSTDQINGSRTGIQDTGASTDTIRPGGYQLGRISDLGTSDDRVVGIYKVTIEDAGSSADKITVRGGRSLTCDSGDGVVTLEETNYVF